MIAPPYPAGYMQYGGGGIAIQQKHCGACGTEIVGPRNQRYCLPCGCKSIAERKRIQNASRNARDDAGAIAGLPARKDGR